MGRLMRCYWVPVLLASEIAEPDSPSVRVKILGEKLLAFRGMQGCEGRVDEFCAYRGASLSLGRNEECGIRCSYHGWKYDIAGQCVELELAQAPQLVPKMKSKALSLRRARRDRVMGPPDKKSGWPELEWCLVPENHRYVTKRLQRSIWLQAMEGGIDTSHVRWAAVIKQAGAKAGGLMSSPKKPLSHSPVFADCKCQECDGVARRGANAVHGG